MRRGLILGLLVLFLITAGWWFLFMSPKSGEISEFNDQTGRGQARAVDARVPSQRTGGPGSQGGRLSARDIGGAGLDSRHARRRRPHRGHQQPRRDNRHRLALLQPERSRCRVPIEGLVEIQMTMTFEAPYFKVLSFLFALEELERLVRVDQISITSTILEDGTNLLSTSLTASAFSLSELRPATTEVAP